MFEIIGGAEGASPSWREKTLGRHSEIAFRSSAKNNIYTDFDYGSACYALTSFPLYGPNMYDCSPSIKHRIQIAITKL
jgi:hypothetical protein